MILPPSLVILVSRLSIIRRLVSKLEQINMAPPSQLSIATASVIRLLKEETSYRTELEGQRKRLQTLEAAESGDDEEGNRAWNIRQEV